MSICREQIVEVGGVRLWTALQGKGRPMVLCHGGPGAYDYLKPVADMADDLCQVLRYDQRRSGRSQAIGPYNVATFVGDLEGLRGHFNFDRWIVGGHSWGASLALAYAVRFPARAAAVVYISGTGVDGRWHDEYRRNRLAALPEAEREEFRRLRAHRDDVLGPERERIAQRLRDLSRKTDVFDPARLTDTPAFDEHPTSDEVNQLVNADIAVRIENPEFQRAVRKLSMPILFLHGAADPRPAQLIEALAASIPRGEFHSIPKAGHYPWIEQPDRFRALLRAFVGEER